jgi:uncharacterized protein
MKKIFATLALFVFTIGFSQIKTDTIDSKKIGEKRVISIHLPASYEKDKNKKYPILVLLDGDYLMNPFVGALDYGNYWDDIPEVVIVGIHQNKNNERDLDCEINEQGLPTKKGVQFFDFINLELLPKIEKEYRIANMRIIAGHDVTASYLNLFLYQNNPAFNAYIALSPNLDADMLERVPVQLALFKRPVFYYQATADGDLKETQEDVSTMAEYMKVVTNENVYFKTDNFKDASHYSLVLHAIPSALYHIFTAYKPITNTEYKEKIEVLQKDYVSYLAKKYEIIKRDYGIEMPIRFSDFKAIEAVILKNKDYNSFDELAILARRSYPKGMLADYYLALQFENKGDDKRALRYYLDAFQQEAVGDLTKDMMMNKAEDIRGKQPKKVKGKKGQTTELPAETPVEEKKN